MRAIKASLAALCKRIRLRLMPGRFFLTHTTIELAELLQADAAGVGDNPVRHNIAPGQEVVVHEDGLLKRMRWGMIPVARVNARGRPVMETIVNARSETVFQKSAFAGVRRCVVPVTGWYEWTGAVRRKTAWAIRAKDGGPLLFAAVADTWDGPGGIKVDQVATLTCRPNADLRDIHHRMGVLLRRSDVATWLDGQVEQAAALMVPWPDGQLQITEAKDVDWDAP